MSLIINEPAAALAYSLDKKVGGERNVSNLFIWEVVHIPWHTFGGQRSPCRVSVLFSHLVCLRHGAQVARPGGRCLYLLHHLTDLIFKS